MVGEPCPACTRPVPELRFVQLRPPGEQTAAALQLLIGVACLMLFVHFARLAWRPSELLLPLIAAAAGAFSLGQGAELALRGRWRFSSADGRWTGEASSVLGWVFSVRARWLVLDAVDIDIGGETETVDGVAARLVALARNGDIELFRGEVAGWSREGRRFRLLPDRETVAVRLLEPIPELAVLRGVEGPVPVAELVSVVGNGNPIAVEASLARAFRAELGSAR